MQSVPEVAAKQREPIVHVNHNTYTTRHEQIENVSNTIPLLFRVVAISNCVYPENEVKRILERRLLYSGRRRNVANQALISGNAELKAVKILPAKVILGLASRRFNHRGGKVSANSLCNVNPAAFHRRNKSKEIHPASATKFQDTNATPAGLLRQEVERFKVNRLIIMIEKIVNSGTSRGPGVLRDLILR